MCSLEWKWCIGNNLTKFFCGRHFCFLCDCFTHEVVYCRRKERKIWAVRVIWVVMLILVTRFHRSLLTVAWSKLLVIVLTLANTNTPPRYFVICHLNIAVLCCLVAKLSISLTLSACLLFGYVFNSWKSCKAVASVPIPDGCSLHPVKNMGEFCFPSFFTKQSTPLTKFFSYFSFQISLLFFLFYPIF